MQRADAGRVWRPSVDTFFGNVTLQISDGNEHMVWETKVLIFDASSTSEETVILGQRGFLEHIQAIFDGEAATLDIEAGVLMQLLGS